MENATENYLAEMRKIMVQEQLRGRGLSNQRVLRVMEKLPRHFFVKPEDKLAAYDDNPLRIIADQTISQPYMVALIVEKLNPQKNHKVLDIGTGSGYQAAVISKLCKAVYSVERIAALTDFARENLNRANVTNCALRVGDGSEGWNEFAPYDGIAVAAGSPSVPEALKYQLSEGGRLVIPVGNQFQQELLIITRNGDNFSEERSIGCIFVPLIGRHGWKPPAGNNG